MLSNEVIYTTKWIFLRRKPKDRFSVLSFSLCRHPSTFPPVCLSLSAHICLSLYLSKKGTHPRLSCLDLHGDLILANLRAVVFQLRPTVLHQAVNADHWIELLVFSVVLNHI